MTFSLKSPNFCGALSCNIKADPVPPVFWYDYRPSLTNQYRVVVRVSKIMGLHGDGPDPLNMIEEDD